VFALSPQSAARCPAEGDSLSLLVAVKCIRNL